MQWNETVSELHSSGSGGAGLSTMNQDTLVPFTHVLVCDCGCFLDGGLMDFFLDGSLCAESVLTRFNELDISKPGTLISEPGCWKTSPFVQTVNHKDLCTH